MDPDSTHQPGRSGARATDASLNMRGPAIDRSQFTVTLSESVEIEVKFFIPRRTFRSVVSGREGLTIEQHYFPRDQTKRLATEFALSAMVEHSQAFSNVRIRKTSFPSGKRSYQVEFKGKKDEVEGARIYRREFSLDISESRFKELSKEAVSGSIIKIRHEIDGYIVERGRKIPIVAQVDEFRAAGRDLRGSTEGFATVDIELPRANLIQALRRGEHSFPFLSDCVELSTQPTQLQQAVATRRIAKYGFDEEGLRALKEIKELAKRPRGK